MRLVRECLLFVLAFVLGNIDRVHSPGEPAQIPVAYAMRAASMSTDMLRDMVRVEGWESWSRVREERQVRVVSCRRRGRKLTRSSILY